MHDGLPGVMRGADWSNDHVRRVIPSVTGADALSSGVIVSDVHGSKVCRLVTLLLIRCDISYVITRYIKIYITKLYVIEPSNSVHNRRSVKKSIH